MDLTPIRKDDIEIGKPLAWPVYDSKKHLLLKEGYVVETQSQLDVLIAKGLFRNPAWSKQSPEEKFGEKENDSPKLDLLSFADVSLQIGDTLQMQIENDQRYGVKLIGYLERKSLLVTAPSSGEGLILMRAGQSVVMRCFSGKNVYAFASSILRVGNTPYPHLHLAYPIEVRGKKIRKSARARTNVPGSVWRENEPERKSPCLLEDISFSGAQLISASPLGEPGDVLRLYLRVSSERAIAYISPLALIKRCGEIQSTEGRKHSYGVEFHNLDPTESFALQILVYQNLFEIS
ncbi:MAG TPA: flagellar brake protein [Burkholderiales bacterium]|nr:flagellar brake protein [Burkholderiales bacterium]